MVSAAFADHVCVELHSADVQAAYVVGHLEPLLVQKCASLWPKLSSAPSWMEVAVSIEIEFIWAWESSFVIMASTTDFSSNSFTHSSSWGGLHSSSTFKCELTESSCCTSLWGYSAPSHSSHSVATRDETGSLSKITVSWQQFWMTSIGIDCQVRLSARNASEILTLKNPSYLQYVCMYVYQTQNEVHLKWPVLNF